MEPTTGRGRWPAPGPARGGAVEELTQFALGENLADALTRRREAYHVTALQEASHRRKATSTRNEVDSAPSIHDIEESLALAELPPADLDDRAPAFTFIESWYDGPRLIEALAAKTAAALARFPDPSRPFVLFTAHSLPARIVEAGDPYPDELAATARLVAERLRLLRTGLAYQSAGRTDEAWLGPDLRDEIRRLAAGGVRELVVCPVGFVADHLEVLYDIDIEAAAVAREVGVRLERAETMNDDPTFIAGLADLVTAARRPVGVA